METEILAQMIVIFLDTVGTGSDSDLVQRYETKNLGRYRMLITDQVVIAPCTDCVQARRPT